MSAEDLIYQLYSFYKVNSNLDLAVKMSTTPQTISNWKTRNSINAIKKKCRELGIYNEIFLNNYDYDEVDYESNDYYVQQQRSLEQRKEKANICQKILEIDEDMLLTFLKVYKKLKQEGNLIKLHETLGKLKFES